MSEDKPNYVEGMLSATTGYGAAFAQGAVFGKTAPDFIGHMPVAVVPEGFRIEQFPELIDSPVRIKESVKTLTAESFSEYYNKFADDDSMIFCNEAAGSIKAILDYHRVMQPRWNQHSLTLELQSTIEWRAWAGNSGTKMSQTDFGLFLEEHAADVVEPDGAEILESAMNLSSTTKVNFRSSQRLSDGRVQLEYSEDVDGDAGPKGQFRLPETFTLGIKVYDGGDGYRVKARLRTRVSDGEVTFWYDIINLAKVKQDAFRNEVNRVKELCNGGSFIFGKSL